MNLKEAFRYMNFLDDLINKAMAYLSEDSFVTKTKEVHLKSKVNPDAEDEVFENVSPIDTDDEFDFGDSSKSSRRAIRDHSTALDFTKFNFDANKIIDLIGEILEEREKLSVAISKAKKSADVDIDVATSSNRKRQIFARRLGTMAKIKPSEIMLKGSDYKFNNEGNQVTYIYDIKQYTSIDFDRNKVKKLIKALSDKCDEVSSDIDRALIITDVEFEPKWSLVDTIEDICEGD